jgi:cyclopropane fatty-acyl-phospholipid synthase-like methyltransferase
MMARTLSHEEARVFYDRFGAKQDRQGFYEDAALERLCHLGNFADANNVLEFGCGTGRLAARLLSQQLPAAARYVGVDLSTTMVQLATERTAAFGDRCTIHQSDGGFNLAGYGGPFDRVVSTYVLDLLSAADIQQFLAQAHQALETGGLLCHAGLTEGTRPLTAIVSSAWRLVHRIQPKWVGGCRPLQLAGMLPHDQWTLIHRNVVTGMGISSEVVIAQAR